MESETGKTKSCLKKKKAKKIFCACIARWRNWDPATQLLLARVVMPMQSSTVLCGIISSFLEVESLYFPRVVNGVNMFCLSVDASRATWICVCLCSFFWNVLDDSKTTEQLNKVKEWKYLKHCEVQRHLLHFRKLLCRPCSAGRAFSGATAVCSSSWTLQYTLSFVGEVIFLWLVWLFLYFSALYFSELCADVPRVTN